MKSIKEIQAKLQELDMYQGKIDGISGKRTKRAIRAFQMLHGLKVDGIVGQNTLNEMFFVIKSRNIPLIAKTPNKKSKYPHESQCLKFYGEVGQNQVTLELPYPMKLAWDKRKTITKISCHRLVHDDLKAIFIDTLNYYGIERIKELGLNLYGGCLNVRKIRGGSRYSTHSWGIAFDIDPEHNHLRWHSPKARLSHKDYLPFWGFVKKHGAYSLGKNKDYDYMHFQFCYR